MLYYAFKIATKISVRIEVFEDKENRDVAFDTARQYYDEIDFVLGEVIASDETEAIDKVYRTFQNTPGY